VTAPARVAIMMDGNGRWAERRGLPRAAGHAEGARAAGRAIEAAGRAGVRELTLFAFSTENWKRPAAEVAAIFDLLARFAEMEGDRLVAAGVRFRALGRTGALPEGVRSRLAALEARTAAGASMTLRLAVNYGGRREILDAAERLARAALRDPWLADGLDEATFARFLYDPELGDPDLVIRTGGERRISNFLLWQLAYSELHITEALWPDFTQADLAAAFADYARRDRRYGAVSRGDPPRAAG
jgi:undecaprenyl diphosphate synthase